MRAFNAKSLLKNYGPVLLALVFLGFSGQAAQASSTWKDLKGYSACGGVDKNGKLQEGCDFEPAKFEKKAVGSCPKGSFFDIGTWSCYSCPAGYNRNAKSINGNKACDKPAAHQTAAAKFEGAKTCPSGTFLDKRNGGECWSCPSGYGRTTAAVDKYNACGRIGKTAVSAVFKARACPEGAFTDPRNGGECWSCPDGFARTGNAVTSGKACKKVLDFKPAIKAAALTCEKGQVFDFVDGGTCWSCPAGTTRTLKSVKTAKACRNTKMKWVLPNRQIYGLFGLGKGADDILAKLVGERTQVDAFVKATAKKGSVNEATALKTAWEVIDSRPWDSPYLSAMIGDIALKAAREPAGQRTAAEKDLLAKVALLIQWDRQFIAYQAKQAHENWVTAARLFYAARSKEMGAAVIYSDSMVTPPDYNELLAGSIQASAGLAGPAGTLLMTLFVDSVRDAILPFRAIAQGAEGVATGWSSASAPALVGPVAIAIAAAVIVTMEIDKFAKLQEAEGKIRQSIAIANRPVDIGTLLQQKNGRNEFLFHWAAVIGADTRPSANFKTRLAAYRAGKNPDAPAAAPSVVFPTISMASAPNAAATGGTWSRVSGAATDIARGADGTTYMVSTEKTAKGFKIYRRAKTANAWSLISGEATRIAVAGDQAWIVNSDGNVFSRMGTGWQALRSPVAQDIGASAKGVWIVGVDGKIYQRQGKGWATISGRARRINIDGFGRPWVVDGQGSVAVRDNNQKWQTLSLPAVDVAIDLPGVAYAAGKDGRIYGRDTKTGKWTALPQKGVTVASGGGEVWSVTAAHEIFRLK